jgi:RanBP1 domain
VIYQHRCKCMIFTETLLNKGTGINEWLTRGVGDAKLLQSHDTKMIRLVMRQEKIQKLLVNHQMDPRIEIQPHPMGDTTCFWRAFDYSDGVALVETTFAFRFKDADTADNFRKAFVAAQNHMTSLGYGNSAVDADAAVPAATDAADNGETPSGESTTSAAAATDDLTNALAGLSTSENAAEEAKES